MSKVTYFKKTFLVPVLNLVKAGIPHLEFDFESENSSNIDYLGSKSKRNFFSCIFTAFGIGFKVWESLPFPEMTFLLRDLSLSNLSKTI